MKKTISIFMSIFLLFISGELISQSRSITYGGFFDKVYDRLGNEYALIDLSLSSTKPIGGGNSTNSLPTYSCSAGYFDLYYAPGSCFDGTTTAASSKRSVLCQVYTDISNFINSPLSSPTNTVRINMYCSDTPANAPSTLGTAGAFYIFPANPANQYPGIVENQIQRAIVSGQDPYSNLTAGTFGGANNFYHGLVNAKLTPLTATWNYNLNTPTITATQIDFYSIMLHEALHSLGFGSLIDQSGFSKFGQTNNYYAHYDLFLKNQSGNPLLSGPSSACSSSSLSFQGSTSVIAPGCNTTVPAGITTCSSAVQYSSANVNNVSVYTPGCWSGGSSLSHFEDYCSTPSGYVNSCSTTANPANTFNDLYYVMSDLSNSGSCYVKRFPKPEERFVLCDLGYSVKSSYSSNTTTPVAMIDGTASSHSYGGSACPGINVWGVNDGLVNGAFTYTALSSFTNAVALPTTAIVSNDSPTTTAISCMEVVYNNATLSTSGASLVVTTPAGYNGLVLVKYLPQNASGQFGNPTYIYVYFLPGNCNPPDACNLVQNGGFEVTNAFGQSYGLLGTLPSDAAISCWDSNGGTPDVCRRNTFQQYNLGVNTLGYIPPVDSYNGAPNNCVVGIASSGVNGSEEIKNNLSSPLTTGTTYQFSLWALNRSGSSSATSSPLVLSIGCLPTFASIGTPSTIANVTVNTMGPGYVWSHHTVTFTYTLPVNTSALVVAIDGIKTTALGFTVGGAYYCFFDDISLVAMPSPTFSIPNANVCGNTSFTNLAQYASPIPGVFSGTGVTTSFSGTNTLYHFNTSGTLTPGNYPVSFSYTTASGCVNSLQQNISVSPLPSISLSSSNYICSNLSTLSSTLSALCTSCGSATNYAWQPASLIGTSVVVSPTVTTIYTVTPIGGICTTSQTLAVQVQSLCCTQSITAFATPSISSTFTLSTATAFNIDLNITNGNWLSLSANQFLFAPNVKLIVHAGGVLRINGSHLYSCDGNMWQGIVVKDGGQVYFQHSNGDNLVEDAITALDITGPLPNGGTYVDVHNTTFNKNYIDINISNYTLNASPYPFFIDNSIFTCRNLPFTSTSWPQTGSSSTATNSSAQLRTAIHGTTGLIPPYLAQTGFSVTTLKNPYSTQKSHIAIQLSSVGVNTTSGAIGIVIGTTTANSFNLFDSHGIFISASNSNVTSLNNVFQNTQTYTVSGGSTFGGSAIYHNTSSLMNTALTLTASTNDVGNRFWDCHRAVEGNNTYLFWMEKSIVRSNQNSSNYTSSAFLPGNTGLFMTTNRFDYYIANNEFTNLQNAIYSPVTVGVFSLVPTCSVCPSTMNGVYAHRFRVSQNVFSAGTGTNTYMDNAVKVAGMNTVPWFVPTVSVTPFIQAVSVKNNTLTEVFRGISVANNTGYQTDLSENTITLKEDNLMSLPQHAVTLLNSNPTASATIGKNIISSNTASYSASSAVTNTNASLIFCGGNGYGLASPSVACNNLSQAYQGFVFDNSNSGALWAGNIMQPMARGLILANSGVIGTQGGTSTAISNQWTPASSWTAASTAQTFVDGSSTAGSSTLYVKAGATYSPTNNQGPIANQNYAQSNNNIKISTGGDYNCAGIPNNRTIKLPNGNDYTSVDQFYMAKMALYRFLHFNDSVRTANGTLGSFYSAQSSNSIGKFVQVEESFYLGDISGGATLNSSISTTNTAEANYKNYYAKYAAYALNDFKPISAQDDAELYALANLCPGTDGACIYQARELYNFVLKKIVNYNACDAPSSDRMANIQSSSASKRSWDVELFPNPASNQITIVGKNQNETLKIVIKDLSNRVVLTKVLETNDFIANLDLSLINGLYFVTITNPNNENTTKKLLIEK